MLLALLIAAVALLAWANGANDNFKGVATLYGSGTLGYRAALGWATAATLAGSALSLVLAGGLQARFAGNGILPQELEASLPALASIALAGAATILLASRLGLPTSTTHALTGALLGVALAAGTPWSALAPMGLLFALPLVLGPLVAIALAWPAAWLAKRAAERPGPSADPCACLVSVEPAPAQCASLSVVSTPLLVFGRRADCARDLPGAPALTARSAAHAMHVLSAGTVCFARAVNDTPKIATLLLAVPATGRWGGLGLVAVAMAAGGWLGARRVAETMSRRITAIPQGQGFLANAVTAALVLTASPLGLPLSTTHVSCGSIFGIALARRSAERRTVATILGAWLTTLPLGMLIAYASYAALG
jgi:PiT family inorganic phosphate transporter